MPNRQDRSSVDLGVAGKCVAPAANVSFYANKITLDGCCGFRRAVTDLRQPDELYVNGTWPAKARNATDPQVPSF